MKGMENKLVLVKLIYLHSIALEYFYTYKHYVGNNEHIMEISFLWQVLSKQPEGQIYRGWICKILYEQNTAFMHVFDLYKSGT